MKKTDRFMGWIILILMVLIVSVTNCKHYATRVSHVTPEMEKACKGCHDALPEINPREYPKVAGVSGEEPALGDASRAYACLIHLKHYSLQEFEGDCGSCHQINEKGSFSPVETRDGEKVNVTQDMGKQVHAYYRSWAGSKYLDQTHAQHCVTCRACHGSFPVKERISMEQCIGCHGNYQNLATLTGDVSPNPHASHCGEIRCTLCHMAHEESELYCNMCHDFDLEIP